MNDMIHLASGQVNFPLRLLELPGPGGVGLDLVYGYDRGEASLPNALAPTGICGLGWHLDRQRIVTDPGLSTSRSGLRFALMKSAGGQELLRDRNITSAGDDRIGFRMATEPTTRAFLDRRKSQWEVQTGDGMVYIYGDETLPGTIEYDLGFGNWFGPTNNPAREERLPIAWNLAKIRLPFGQEYVFHYESDEAGVTDSAGESRTYTRASYLTRIIGPGRDELELFYEERAPFEYTPYHGNQASVFRDRYESRFLRKVRLLSPFGKVLSETRLIYEDQGQTVYLGSDDAHRKRLLMAVRSGATAIKTEQPDEGDFMFAPDTLCDYWGRDPGDGVSPGTLQFGSALYGALKTVTAATGLVQSFDYTTVEGGASARDISVDRADSERVYFASEYAVLTAYDTVMTVQPVVRAGRWLLSEKFTRAMSPGEYAAARVAIQDENFAILAGGTLNLFARSDLRPDAWITASFAVAADAVGPVAGSGFVSVVEDGSPRIFTLRYAKSGEPPVWVASRTPAQMVRGAETADLVGVDGRNNFMLTATYTSATGALTVVLDFLENNGYWNADAELKATRTTTTTITPVRTATGLEVETGEGFAVITLQYPESMGANDAKYLLCRWDSDFRNLELRELTDRSRPTQPNPAREENAAGSYSIAAVRGGLMGVDQSLFRVNGDKNPIDSKIVLPPAKDIVYAPDLCLLETAATGGRSSYRVLEFDPGAETFKETFSKEGVASLPMAAAGQSEESAEADYMLTGGTVYYRDWNATPGITGLWKPVSGVTPGANATGARFGAGFFVYEENSTVKAYALLQAQATAALTKTGTLLGAGPRSFAVAAAGTVTLYWFEDGQAEGLVSAYPAGKVSNYDGERTTAVRYEFADAGGTVSKGAIAQGGLPLYNRVIRRSGGAMGKASPVYDNGRIEHYFFTGPVNGRTGTAVNYTPYPDPADGPNSPPAYNSSDAAGAVTGLPYLAKTYDAADSEESVNVTQYLTYRNPAGNLGEGRFAGAGVFVRLYTTTATHKGITNYLEFTYDDQGRLSTESSRNVDSSGKDQTGTVQFSYFDAFKTYNDLALRSNLSQIVIARTRQVKTHIGLVIHTVTYPSTEVTTFRDWSPELSSAESWAPFKSYRWIQDPKVPGNAATVVAYDAENPDATEPPPGWELQEAVLTRGAGGMPTLGRDAGGVYYSTLYDEITGQTPLAGFSGARFDQDQCTYCGFETYEPTSFDGWVGPNGLPLSAGIRSDDSAIGERSYFMEAGAGGPRRAMRPDFSDETEPRAFVFSCFAKSEAGYAGGARWIITAYHDDTKIQTADLDLVIPVTNQRWVYIQKIIDPAQIRAAAGLGAESRIDYVLNADNTDGAGDVRLDQLRFAPIDGNFSALAYEYDRRRLTASTGANGEIQRFLRAPANSTGAVVTNNDGTAPGERVALLNGSSLSRLVSRTSTPLESLPDHTLNLGAGETSAYVDFRNARPSDWEFTGAWEFKDGTLACTTAGNAVFQDFAVTAFALRLRIVERRGSVKITTDAGGFVLTRNDNGWELDPGSGLAAVSAPASGPKKNEDLLFVRLDGLLALYANGRQIFALAADGGQTAGPAKIQITSQAGSSFADFTLTDAPPGSFSFQDGGGRAVQTLAVLGQSGVAGDGDAGVRTVVRGALYDALGRPYINRRPVTTNLVFAGSMLVAETDTYLCAPTGKPVDLDTYISGTTDENGRQIIDYTRVYYTASPNSRPRKSESPRAVAEDPSLYTDHLEPDSDANCAVFDDLVGPAPGGAGRYGVGREYDGTGRDGYGLMDQWGRALYSRIVMGAGYLTTGMIYDDAGNLIEKRPPNYFEPPPGSQPSDWSSTFDYDLLRGLLLSENSGDRGLTQYIYDSVGRLRFRQDARNAAAGQVVYEKYDRVGRRIETGTVPWTNAWSDLQENADDPTWPSSGNTYRKRFLYDYDETAPATLYLLGRLRSTATNNGPQPDVETLSYDALGKTSEHVLSVPDFDAGAPQTTTYTRDETGRVRSIAYPAEDGGGTRLEVGYYYDRCGRLNSIGDANAPTAPQQQRYSAYSYDRMGRIVGEALNGAAGLAAQFSRTVAFNPAGLPVVLDDEYWRETLDYDGVNAPGAAEQYNGRINATTFQYKPERWSCPPSDYGYDFEYDDKRRLTRALHSGEDRNTLVFAADEYLLTGGFDANGNLLTYRRGLSRRGYSYANPAAPATPLCNRVYGMDTTTDALFDPSSVDGHRAGDYSWGSSNGGPSGTAVNDPVIAVAGASPGRYEYLRIESYLEQRATYRLTYEIKVDEGFDASSAGQCGWFARGKTAAGEIFEIQLTDASDATAVFTPRTLSIDVAALAAQVTSEDLLEDLRVEFRNGRWALAGGPAGPVYLQNVRLTTGAPASGTPAPAIAIGAYDYDPAGATKTAPELALVYDPVIRRPATITRRRGTASAVVDFRYGASNQRLRKQVAAGEQSASRWYFHGGRARPLMRLDRDDAGEDQRAGDGVSYIYGPRGLIAIRGRGGLHFALKDHLGSTRVLVNEQGEVDRYYDYLPYGGLMRTGPGTSETRNEHRYTGQEQDGETGLYNYRARLYDPDLRRFLSPDPARQTDSPYSYVDGNPVSRTDPTGRAFISSPEDALSFLLNMLGYSLSYAINPNVSAIGTGAAIYSVFGLRLVYSVGMTGGGGLLYHPVARLVPGTRLTIHYFGMNARYWFKLVVRALDPTHFILEEFDPVTHYPSPTGVITYEEDEHAWFNRAVDSGAAGRMPRWWLTDFSITGPALLFIGLGAFPIGSGLSALQSVAPHTHWAAAAGGVSQILFTNILSFPVGRAVRALQARYPIRGIPNASCGRRFLHSRFNMVLLQWGVSQIASLASTALEIRLVERATEAQEEDAASISITAVFATVILFNFINNLRLGQGNEYSIYYLMERLYAMMAGLFGGDNAAGEIDEEQAGQGIVEIPMEDLGPS